MDIVRYLRQQWDRVAAVVASALGLLAIFLGYRGVSNRSLPAEQIPYLASGAVLGLFALGIAATLWLSADLRDEWRKLDDIYRHVQQRDEAATNPPVVENGAHAGNGSSQTDLRLAPESRAPRRATSARKRA